jgi:hypothetical protein
MADALLAELDRIVGPHARTRFIEEAVVERLVLRGSADALQAHDSRDRKEALTGEADALAALSAGSLETPSSGRWTTERARRTARIDQP